MICQYFIIQINKTKKITAITENAYERYTMENIHNRKKWSKT